MTFLQSKSINENKLSLYLLINTYTHKPEHFEEHSNNCRSRSFMNLN